MGSMGTICTVLGIIFLVLGFGFALWDEFLRRLILEKKVHNKVMVRLT